ncbi:D-alanyl-D-alanine carboxypeptidase family protein [Paenibacillus spongiae]|uniref:D-alanyl-D-alanine carboxypeptidase family protein n=1 Tax=Paenibacillus spongiae TaxID=2909671 RepID=A0ABY5SAY0_9BACL|nr:D-alanyl-D-alanine carboxypeptidase family protein [Paenibacillus spongiae]UVI30668.1 D-alanyl-D-alanine carboxypeptidase family protein [Paenibacillus spongiae]
MRPAAEHIVRLHRGMIHSGSLVLVNREHPIAEHYRPDDIVPVTTIQQAGTEESQIRLHRTGYRQLNALLEASHAAGSIGIVSGYRTLAQQKHIYDSSLEEHGAAFTASYVARPNESEHQTGLAVDVGQLRDDVDYLCPSLPDHGVYASFKQLAAEFGFIQRYKEGKEAITNIACEPWHYRYVGVPHAIIMENYDLCLEEYIVYMKQFAFEGTHLYMKVKQHLIEIYAIDVADEGETLIPIRSGSRYEWSGNNTDGFIVTIFHDLGKVIQ